MPQTCSVCRHSELSQIDKALLAGEPFRSIAKRVSLSPAALFRHKSHVEKRLVEARESEEASQGRDLVKELVKLAARADKLASQAERDGDLRTALAGVRELARLLELEARLAGQIGGANIEVNINNLDIARMKPQQRSDLMVRLFEVNGLPVEIARAFIVEPDKLPPIDVTPSPAATHSITQESKDSKNFGSQHEEVSFKFRRPFTIEELDELRED
jgi:hypothetical protein